ncbi:MAG: CU044_5270 family protein, partial [Solirubrobacteraceae bacterium]
RWPARAIAAGLALAACIAVVELVGSGAGTGPSPALAAALGRLASIAASGPSLVPGPGQFLYVDSTDDSASIAVGRHRACISYAPDHRQVWIGADGSGLLRDTTGITTFTSPSDRALCLSMKISPSSRRGTSNLWFAAGCFTLGPTNDMQALSTDPRTLLRQMRRIDGGPRTAAEDLVHVGDFLRETDAGPALRAALYRAAALIPGVQLLGRVRDRLGRHGLGVAYDSRAGRDELIFNPRTAALMAEDEHTPGPSAVDYWAVYRQSRVVDQVPRRSPLPLTPPCINGGGHVAQTRLGSVMTGAHVAGQGPGAAGPTTAGR